MPNRIVFLVDLVQDVAIVSPLIRLLRCETDLSIVVFSSGKFALRDVTGTWSDALRKTCASVGVTIETFESEWDIFNRIQTERGFLVSASESTVGSHIIAHRVFRCAPSSFITVTLQHGFECVGFLHNRAHDRVHGNGVEFAADVVCSWFSRAALKSLAPSQAHKLYVAGPPSVIDIERSTPPGENVATPPRGARLRGLVCENLHSVRLESEVSRAEFLNEFYKFLDDLEHSTYEITLRAHPAGRFTEVRGISLPEGVSKSEGLLQNTLDLGFDFGISAPSTVLFDMIKSNIPVAVWQDSSSVVDYDNYLGLPVVSQAREWARFAMMSLTDRAPLIDRQNAFLARFEIPSDVSSRYLELFGSMP